LFTFLTDRVLMRTIIDLVLVLLILTRLFKWLRGTKGIFFINAIIILYLANIISDALSLKYLGVLFQWIMTMLVVALPIIFQHELKQILEFMGHRNPIIKWFVKAPNIAIETIDVVVEAVSVLSENKIGALIVFEREDSLGMVRDSGSNIDAIVNKILIEQIFYPGSPLHDGAIVIKGSRIVAAGCFLPLDNQLILPQKLGSRHRAGLSIATQSDALVIIVSEESGGISYANDGKLKTGLNCEKLKTALRELIYPVESKPVSTGAKITESGKEVSKN
jgi:diadenylate cyclase